MTEASLDFPNICQKSWRIQNLLRSQAFGAQCDTAFITRTKKFEPISPVLQTRPLVTNKTMYRNHLFFLLISVILVHLHCSFHFTSSGLELGICIVSNLFYHRSSGYKKLCRTSFNDDDCCDRKLWYSTLYFSLYWSAIKEEIVKSKIWLLFFFYDIIYSAFLEASNNTRMDELIES